MQTLFVRFAKDESGTTAIEYGLIATLIGVAIIAGASALGTALNVQFGDLGGVMDDRALPGDDGGIGAGAGGGEG